MITSLVGPWRAMLSNLVLLDTMSACAALISSIKIIPNLSCDSFCHVSYFKLTLFCTCLWLTMMGPNESSSVLLSIVVRALLISLRSCCHLRISLPTFSASSDEEASQSAWYCSHCSVYSLAWASFCSMTMKGSASTL